MAWDTTGWRVLDEIDAVKLRRATQARTPPPIALDVLAQPSRRSRRNIGGTYSSAVTAPHPSCRAGLAPRAGRQARLAD